MQSLINELQLTNNTITAQGELLVAVQCLANSAADIKNGIGLPDRLPELYERIRILRDMEIDVIIMTELNRQLTDEQKQEIPAKMAEMGYNLTGSFIRNGGGPWTHETAMYHSNRCTATSESVQCSYVPPAEGRDYPLLNGAIIADIEKNGITYKIGAIHCMLINRIQAGFTPLCDVLSQEWAFIANMVRSGVKMFGDFNVTYELLMSLKDHPGFIENVRDCRLSYTNIPDFICSNYDFIPANKKNHLGDDCVIEEDNRGIRIVDTLCKSAGGAELISMLHPVDPSIDIIGMTHKEVAELTRGMDFSGGCFDHATLIARI